MMVRPTTSTTGMRMDYPSADPFVVAVGGTASNLGRSQEDCVPWNCVERRAARDGGRSAGGGGVSTVFPLPTFQNGIGVPKSVNPGHKAGRGVPDVAANADPETGYLGRTGGKEWVVAEPGAHFLQATLIARITARAKQSVGYVTPQLYRGVGAKPRYGTARCGLQAEPMIRLATSAAVTRGMGCVHRTWHRMVFAFAMRWLVPAQRLMRCSWNADDVARYDDVPVRLTPAALWSTWGMPSGIPTSTIDTIVVPLIDFRP